MALSILDNVNLWLSATPGQQDEAIEQTSALLGADYRPLSTSTYSFLASLRIATFQHIPSQIEFNLIPGGTFLMGFSDREEKVVLTDTTEIEPEDLFAETMRPVHEVRVEPFLISWSPLTSAFVTQYLELDPQVLRPKVDWHSKAIVCLTRQEAAALVHQFGFQMPSEAQWEYACRATTQTPFYFGDSLPSEAVLDILFRIDNYTRSMTVAAATNPFGLAGLFFGEWCADAYRPNYSHRGLEDIPVTGSSPYVVRGGAASLWPWQGCGEWMFCLSAHRFGEEVTGDPQTDIPWAVRFVQKIHLPIV